MLNILPPVTDLYDPEAMPKNLRHAHERNDEVLGTHLYRKTFQE